MKGINMKPSNMFSIVKGPSITFTFVSLSCLIVSQLLVQKVFAQNQSKDEVKKLAERIVGTKLPGDSDLVSRMRILYNNGDKRAAAQLAINDPSFINITVKQMGLKMSTRAETMRTELNDFVATYMGIIRDDLDARLMLTGDFYYRGQFNPASSGGTVEVNVLEQIVISNEHYIQLDRPSSDLNAILRRVDKQPMGSQYNNSLVLVDNPDPAGLLTTRAFMAAHAEAGTNRRPVEYTMREFTCLAMADWSDVGASDARIGRDIDRAPGGDAQKFQTSCKGCHTGMDGFRTAFSKNDFRTSGDYPRGRVINSLVENNSFGGFNANTRVSDKMDRNPNNRVFPNGYVPIDTSWVNNSRGPANSELFGWRGNVSSGFGVRSFAEAISNSRRFSQCMVQRVYEGICRRPFSIAVRKAYTDRMADILELNSYSVKTLAAEIAVSEECGL